MGVWSALGVFLLGSAAGALTTATYYSAQIRQLKRLIESNVTPNGQEHDPSGKDQDERRKSA